MFAVTFGRNRTGRRINRLFATEGQCRRYCWRYFLRTGRILTFGKK